MTVPPREIAIADGHSRLVAQAERDVDTILGYSRLARLAWSWKDVQQTRLACEQRGFHVIAAQLLVVERALVAETTRDLRKHILWPWLSQFPGLRGVHVARLIALINDPFRFPGRQCSAGHIVSAAHFGGFEKEIGGDVCGQDRFDGPCEGILGPVRRGTGVRSLWHYLGLHVVDGRSPRKTKGQVADWSPIGRTICLQPGGLAEQIVRQRTPVYRDLYDAAKDRLTRERGADVSNEVVATGGPALPDGPETDQQFADRVGHWPITLDGPEVEDTRALESGSGLRPIDREGASADSPGGPEADPALEADTRAGLRPIQIEGIARKVAVKAFVADLLTEWKRLLLVVRRSAITPSGGREEAS